VNTPNPIESTRRFWFGFLCVAGRSEGGRGESGWNFSQLPLSSDSASKLPPAGRWSGDRHCSESSVSYDRVNLAIKPASGGSGSGTRQYKDKAGHVLEYHPGGRDSRWACDGKLLSGGCKSGITGFGQTAGVAVYSCKRGRCDLDYCVPCVNHYADASGMIRCVLFLSVSLCLSRACLGKIFVFIYKWLKKTCQTPFCIVCVPSFVCKH
jgi:hypothetical protein